MHCCLFAWNVRCDNNLSVGTSCHAYLKFYVLETQVLLICQHLNATPRSSRLILRVQFSLSWLKFSYPAILPGLNTILAHFLDYKVFHISIPIRWGVIKASRVLLEEKRAGTSSQDYQPNREGTERAGEWQKTRGEREWVCSVWCCPCKQDETWRKIAGLVTVPPGGWVGSVKARTHWARHRDMKEQVQTVLLRTEKEQREKWSNNCREGVVDEQGWAW